METSDRSKLLAAVKTVIERNPENRRATLIAADILQKPEEQWLSRLIDQWSRERVTAIVRSELSLHDDPRRAWLGGSEYWEQFRKLPLILVRKGGKRIPTADATRAALKEKRQLLLASFTSDARLRPYDEALELMNPHSNKNPRVTLGEVIQIEAEKSAKRAKRAHG
jgi:hypothetical protein